MIKFNYTNIAAKEMNRALRFFLSKDFLQNFDFFLNNSVKLNKKLKVISLSLQLIQR